MGKFAPMARLLYGALDQLAASKKFAPNQQVVYRGIPLNLANEYPEGKLVVWRGFSSCSVDRDVAVQFAGQGGTFPQNSQSTSRNSVRFRTKLKLSCLEESYFESLAA